MPTLNHQNYWNQTRCRLLMAHRTIWYVDGAIHHFNKLHKNWNTPELQTAQPLDIGLSVHQFHHYELVNKSNARYPGAWYEVKFKLCMSTERERTQSWIFVKFLQEWRTSVLSTTWWWVSDHCQTTTLVSAEHIKDCRSPERQYRIAESSNVIL